MIRVVIADDHHLVRQGLRHLLARERDIQVVGEATDGRDAIDMVSRLRPDVVVMDVEMPIVNGIEATKRICRSNADTRLVMLSMYSDSALIRKALEYGAGGYVLKQSVSKELVDAIRSVHSGVAYRPRTLDQFDYSIGRFSQDGATSLTAREQEILHLISAGQTNRQIAATLSISVKTVENHRVNLMAKLDAHSLAELIRTAIQRGLISLEE